MGQGTHVPVMSTKAEKKKKRLLSTHEAAEYVCLSIPTFRRYREQGRIKFYKAGDHLYKYDTEDLDEFLKKSTRSA
jgi:excisionase family DNA binding protein